MEVLGITRTGTIFDVTLLGQVFQARFDSFPFVNCAKGELIAISEPNHGNILLCIHNVFNHESAADKMGRAKAGDAISFSRREKKRPGKLANSFTQLQLPLRRQDDLENPVGTSAVLPG
jgi:hypothetical protein